LCILGQLADADFWQILELYIEKIPMDDDIKIISIARGTAGFSGAELSNLVNTAALKVPTAVSFMFRSLSCGPL
jgi:ATP-dependent 26S proteasome regulatory subunit